MHITAGHATNVDTNLLSSPDKYEHSHRSNGLLKHPGEIPQRPYCICFSCYTTSYNDFPTFKKRQHERTYIERVIKNAGLLLYEKRLKVTFHYYKAQLKWVW